jgi:hypothetical protein
MRQNCVLNFPALVGLVAKYAPYWQEIVCVCVCVCVCVLGERGDAEWILTGIITCKFYSGVNFVILRHISLNKR